MSDDSAKERGVIEGVRSWLNLQGYPLEMRVAAEYRKAKALVTQSDYVLTPTGHGTAREIDVRARFMTGKLTSGKGAALQGIDVSSVCECKSYSKNWVIFTAETQIEPASKPLYRMGNFEGRDLFIKASLKGEVESLELLRSPKRFGYSLTVANDPKSDEGRDAKDAAPPPAPVTLKDKQAQQQIKKARQKSQEDEHGYGAVMKVFDVATALAEEKLPETISIATLIFPVIVVDSHLVECWLGEDNKIQLALTDRASLLWRNPTISGSATIIDVVHERALPEYVRHVKAASDALQEFWRRNRSGQK
jgi:hypothetical protein